MWTAVRRSRRRTGSGPCHMSIRPGIAGRPPCLCGRPSTGDGQGGQRRRRATRCHGAPRWDCSGPCCSSVAPSSDRERPEIFGTATDRPMNARPFLGAGRCRPLGMRGVHRGLRSISRSMSARAWWRRRRMRVAGSAPRPPPSSTGCGCRCQRFRTWAALNTRGLMVDGHGSGIGRAAAASAGTSHSTAWPYRPGWLVSAARPNAAASVAGTVHVGRREVALHCATRSVAYLNPRTPERWRPAARGSARSAVRGDNWMRAVDGDGMAIPLLITA